MHEAHYGRVRSCILRAAGVALLLLALAPSSPAAPEPPVLLGPHGGPSTIFTGPTGRLALDGTWIYAKDRNDYGTLKGWTAGSFAGQRVKLPFVPDARKITGQAGIENFRGTTGWYRTTFQVGRPGTYAFRFESVHHHAQVWLNGRKVRAHKGVYLPFQFRSELEPGRDNVLVVRADWRSPTRLKRDGWHRTWFNFGGVNREVTIRPVGPSEISGPTLRTRLDGREAIVDVTAILRNDGEARDIDLQGTLTREGRRVTLDFPVTRVERGQRPTVSAQVRIPDAELWSPDTPDLWNLNLDIPGESGYQARTGLREVRADGRDLLVNGKPVLMRGASIHEDVYGRGDGLLPADQDELVAQLKALGANATRSQHTMHPALLERLDAAGIMVWQGIGPIDAPGAWTSRGPERVATARRRARANVEQGQLHPSIITWNLANEVAGGGHPSGQIPYIDQMAAELHQTDPGRPVALDIWGAHAPKRDSLIYRHIDMIGWTNYIGWYEGTFDSREQLRERIRTRLNELRRVFPNKVIAVTEFGAEANGQNPTTRPGGYAFQSALLDLHLKTYEQISDLAGALVWNLRDFAVAPSFAGGSISRSVPDIRLVRGVNQKGLFNLSDRPKPAARLVAQNLAVLAKTAAARAATYRGR